MSVVGLLVALLSAGVAAGAAAQQVSPVASGLDAFFAGDASTAIALLKAHIFSTDEADPWALYVLGLLHRDGKGATEDRVLACAYFKLATTQFALHGGDGSVYDQMASHAFEATCTSLGADDVNEMNQLLACPHEGPPSGVATLAPQHWVVVERTKWRVAYEGEEQIYPIVLPGCRSVVFPVVHTELAGPGVPPGDPRERRFLQYFVWVPGRSDGKAVKQLFWIVDEVRANRISRVLTEAVYLVDDAWYPAPEALNLEQLAQLTVTPSGEIAWTIATEPPRSGLIPIPVERTRRTLSTPVENSLARERRD